jgi:hypothetical protein
MNDDILHIRVLWVQQELGQQVMNPLAFRTHRVMLIAGRIQPVVATPGC